MPKARRRAGARGFTLLELLVVLVLVAVGSALSMVAVDRQINRAERTRWIERTQSVLLALRGQALREGRRVAAWVDTDGGRLVQTLEGRERVWLTLPKGFGFRVVVGDEGGGEVEAEPRMNFSPDGGADAAAFELLTPGGAPQRFVVARITGQVMSLTRPTAP